MSKKQITSCALILLVLTVCKTCLAGYSEINTPLLKANQNIDSYFSWFYKTLGSDFPKPEYEVFNRALTGFFNLKAGKKIKNNQLTIIDFSISSNMERMWILDMNKMKIIHYSLVAHGRNSGEEYARYFSNKPSSYQSSLGFFLTDEIYYGMHGISLYLDGVEPEVNDKARERTIVMHAANYVSKDFIHNNGRLGRSLGCPAIPIENHENIIKILSGRSCIYIHYPDDTYFNTSLMFTPDSIEEGLSSFLSETSVTFNIDPGLFSVSSKPLERNLHVF